VEVRGWDLRSGAGSGRGSRVNAAHHLVDPGPCPGEAQSASAGGGDFRAAGRTPSLGLMIVDMIEEYARHLGHADIIR